MLIKTINTTTLSQWKIWLRFWKIEGALMGRVRLKILALAEEKGDRANGIR
ncbi:hypothetical protein QUB37_17555 [Microcoleus sp. AT3-A2]|uniref:hypothetical protein n=1 Tax=Microcoleus sp. AT3-A2 TaxID=2818610 RepID=UPI002FD5B7B8